MTARNGYHLDLKNRAVFSHLFLHEIQSTL